MRPRLRDIPDRRGGRGTAGPFLRLWEAAAGQRARPVGEPRVFAERHLAAGGADPVRQDQVGGRDGSLGLGRFQLPSIVK